jgi:16S rRNA (adenine1518-N6/adenine1519-N6)-dimethyltransferase
MIRAKRSLGQNFLMHPRIAERIALIADIQANDTVLEIGPGTGILTRALLARANHVIAIETDEELFALLQETFAEETQTGKLDLRNEDIRGFHPTLIKSAYVLVANIPYYLTGEIFRMFLSGAHQPRSMTMLVQKEVAARIARDKKESILSLSIKVFGTPKYEFTVPRGAFKPTPSIDSAVLSIKDISRKNFASPKAERRFFTYIRAGFAHKRKLLVNNLREEGLTPTGIPPKARAEDLTLTDWLTLMHRLPI